MKGTPHMIETVPNTFPGLFWAYFVFFVCIVAYVLSLARRVRHLEEKAKEEKTKARAQKSEGNG